MLSVGTESNRLGDHVKEEAPDRLVDTLVSLQPTITSRYSRPLSGLSHRFDKDDLYQTTCMRAYRGFASHRGNSDDELKAWVMKIAANVYRSAVSTHAKCAKRSTRVEQSAVLQLGNDTVGIEPEDSSEAQSPASIREEYQKVLASIDRLPKQRQGVLRMRFIEGRTYKEIAAELGITVNAVRSSVHQALQAARAEIQQPALPGFFD